MSKSEQSHHRRAVRNRRSTWRALTLLTAMAAGGLFVVTSLDSGGMDLRASGVTDLPTVVKQERTRTDALQAKAAALTKEVEKLSRSVSGTKVDTLQRRVDRLKSPAGLTKVEGAGVTVVLDDAPKDVLNKAIKDGTPAPDELVVHQQDIQAVVNALWAGGARAMTIQGQRVIATTGIKCVGNTVILQGVPYAPPYRISAIGETTDMLAALKDSSYIQAYQVMTKMGLRYDVTSESELVAPAYKDALSLQYARPAKG